MIIINILIGELHKVFDYINETKFNNELKRPVITAQPEKTKKKDTVVMGWCSRLPRWTKTINSKETHHYEVNMVIDQLERSFPEIMATFIHELTHLANSQRNIDDCSVRQYHNKKFKELANELGLIVEKVEKRGWSQTSLSQPLLDEIMSLDLNLDAFNLSKVVELKERKPTIRKPIYKYRCKNCGKEVKSTEENMSIQCLDCEMEYIKI